MRTQKIRRAGYGRTPETISHYALANKWESLVVTSGQTAVDSGTGELITGGITEQTRQTLFNMKNVLKAAGSGLDRIIKTTVFLKDINDIEAVNAVFAEFFGKGGYPARSIMQVGRLPKDALIEIETIAVKNSFDPMIRLL